MHVSSKCKRVPYASQVNLSKNGTRPAARKKLSHNIDFMQQKAEVLAEAPRSRDWTESCMRRTLCPMEVVARGEKPDPNEKLRDVPHKPGVYLMKDRLKRVIYVGKARDLRKRLGQYFIPSRRLTADLKTRALLDSVWDFEIHPVRNEPEALLLEG